LSASGEEKYKYLKFHTCTDKANDFLFLLTATTILYLYGEFFCLAALRHFGYSNFGRRKKSAAILIYAINRSGKIKFLDFLHRSSHHHTHTTHLICLQVYTPHYKGTENNNAYFCHTWKFPTQSCIYKRCWIESRTTPARPPALQYNFTKSVRTHIYKQLAAHMYSPYLIKLEARVNNRSDMERKKQQNINIWHDSYKKNWEI
jgi:hypothetical protein